MQPHRMVMGTAFAEEGRWMLRHEGGEGRRIPLEGPQGFLAELKDGSPFVFVGRYILDQNGHPIAAYVTGLQDKAWAQPDRAESLSKKPAG